MAGTLACDTIQNGAGTTVPTTTVIAGSAKAWVQFAGSTGTIAGSFNVSSITRNNTGYYTVNFTTAMPNANYSAFASAAGTSGGGNPIGTDMFCDAYTGTATAPTTSSYVFSITNYNGGVRFDSPYVMSCVFSN